MASPPSVKICDTNNPTGSFACFNCNVDVFTKLSHLCQIKKQSDDTIIDFTEFLRTIHRDSICFKVLTNRDKFITEYANIDILKEIFKDKFSDYTTFYEYDGCVGFEITIKGVCLILTNYIVNPFKQLLYMYYYNTNVMILLRTMDMILNNLCHI